jgi:hypothetical protein
MLFSEWLMQCSCLFAARESIAADQDKTAAGREGSVTGMAQPGRWNLSCQRWLTR